jgi:hypothetical protein
MSRKDSTQRFLRDLAEFVRNADRPKEPVLRDTTEIQSAHDRLLAVIVDDVPHPFGDRHDYLCEALSGLCWVMNHGHGGLGFGNNLATLERWWDDNGIVFLDAGELVYADSEPPALTTGQRNLLDRQRTERIDAGIEHRCKGCGCSETQRCDRLCSWANKTKTLCSRCNAKLVVRTKCEHGRTN